MSTNKCEVCGSVDFLKLFTKEEHDYFQCRSCGLIRLDPQPTDAVLGSIYGGHYYNAWGVQNGADRVYDLKKKTFRRHVFNQVHLPAGARILDCGAAFGALMSAAADEGWEPYGIELAEEAAVQIAARFGKDRVFTGPFEDATFPSLNPCKFDALFMCDFIEHVRDPRAVLIKAGDLLKPGGYVVMTTPDGGSLSCKLMKRGWLHYKTEHLHYFNQRNMPRLLDQLGFRTVVAQSASKVLDFDYVDHQLQTYPRPVLSPVLHLATRCMGGFRNRPLSFSFGEMIVVATKN
jgi:SAM-dependent methyltransferase